MYIETSSNNHGSSNVSISFEKTDFVQISNITFYYNRYSILATDFKKSMVRFVIQLLFEDNAWRTQNTIPKNSQYSDTSSQCTKLNLSFFVESYGIKLVYVELIHHTPI